MSSYDDLIPFNYTDYCFNKVMEWITSCREFGQMKAADNAIKLFRKKYPKEKALSQHLYLKYWQIKRELK